MSDNNSDLRIVLLGKTGVGKSSLGNTILGQDVFSVGLTANSGTAKCQKETRSVEGRGITLIDTPGFFGTTSSEEELKAELAECITECAFGVHAFLIVLKVERFTEQENQVINKIKECFSEEAFKYAVVVFTHGDELDDEMTIEEFVSQNENLSDLLEKCKNRCHVIDNKYWKNNQHEYKSNEVQVENLLNTIQEMADDEGLYTNKMLQAVKDKIQEEEEGIRKTSANLTKEEIREKAKRKVSKFLKKIAGVTTGALLGALFGVPVMVGAAATAVRTTVVTLKKRFNKKADRPAGNTDLRIVLLGKTGVGKSSLGNTILGEEVFKKGHTAKSGTTECQAKTRCVNDRGNITLIDTPGFFDTKRSEEELKPEIVKCVTECAPGIHAFLIVLKVDKFTEHENQVIDKIKSHFGDEAFKHAVVVFTHGDQLSEGQKIDEFVRQNKNLSDLLEKCSNRCHVIDNKRWKNNQQDEYRNNKVDKLLDIIQKVANKENLYTNEMLQAVESKIQEEKERLRQTSPGLSEEVIREKAKINVSNHLKKVAGVTTGALLGALLGVPVMIGAVVAAFAAAGAAEATVAAVGGAAGGEIALGVAAGVAAAAGAVVGGFIGYDEADKAGSVKEAVVNTAKAVVDTAKNIVKKPLKVVYSEDEMPLLNSKTNV